MEMSCAVKGGRGNVHRCVALLLWICAALSSLPADAVESSENPHQAAAAIQPDATIGAAANSPSLVRGSGNGVGVGRPSKRRSSQAYVTLCYRETYVLGVRVLGQSIRESGSTMDMVVLVTGISSSSRQTLEMDGWIVKQVDLVENPGTGPRRKGRAGYPPRFWAVYTKLLVFGLTEYSTIVYLDADIMVLSNLDHLFSCSGFCAVMRVGERFNSGLMVIQPSQEVLNDMLERISTTPSYTGGDQGFLNEYYKAIIDAPLFHPSEAENHAGIIAMRLTTDYNSDIGAYVINGGLWHQENDPKVLHFTLGPFKPWHWWMSWLTDQHSAWLKVRSRLGEDSHGYSGGDRLRLAVGKWLLVPIPLLLSVWLLRALAWDAGLKHVLLEWLSDASYGPGAARKQKPRSRLVPHPWNSGATSSTSYQRGWSTTRQLLYCMVFGKRSVFALGGHWGSSGTVLQQPSGLPEVASLVGIAGLMLALAASVLLVVPNDSQPTLAWVLVYEWTFLGLFLAVSRLLHTCYQLGNASGHLPAELDSIYTTGSTSTALQDTDNSGGRKAGPSDAVIQAWGTTVRCSLLSIICISLSPWASQLCHINDIVAKILITAFSGVFALLVLCHSLGDMATAWFSAGAVGLSIRDVAA